MAGVHWIDALTPPLEGHFKRMVDWIKPHLKGGPPPEPEPPKAKIEPKVEARPKAAPPPEPRPATPAPAQSKGVGRALFDAVFGGQAGESVFGPAGAKPAPAPAQPKASSALPVVPGMKPEQDTLSGLFDLGLEYARQNKHDEAILAYRRLIAAFDADDRPLFREQVIRSFFKVRPCFRYTASKNSWTRCFVKRNFSRCSASGAVS